jgi:DNA polymerase V
MPSLFALADCNNFYVSCERVFNPRLAGKPVVALSNNDGCVIARSNEAKALGIGMGTPLFKIQDVVKTQGVHVYSSNYALYGDMSRRVIEVLSRFTPDIEVYSIDEAFLNLSGFGKTDLADYGRTIKSTVLQWTGIPVSVGIAETKTLCKVAARIAKKSKKADGVVDLTNSPHLDYALSITPVEDIWGVGRNYAVFLKGIGIANALQLRDAPEGIIRKKMGISGIRIIRELKGVSCYPLEKMPPPKQEITVSRSFKHTIEDKSAVMEAVAAYASRGAEKLRAANLEANALVVFLTTNPFSAESGYFTMKTVQLPLQTNSAPELIAHARRCLEDIYKEGRSYKKAGVIFRDLAPEGAGQADLFVQGHTEHAREIMEAFDRINRKYGRDAIRYAATGNAAARKWETSFQRRSPSWTTDWNQLPIVS